MSDDNTPKCVCSHCETARIRKLNDRIDTLKGADFAVGYAWRDVAETFGYFSSSEVTWEWSGGYRLLTVDGERHASYGEPYVCLSRVAAGEDTYGQTSSVYRSNYRSIKRDYPQVPWIDTSYTNQDALGVFIEDLDDDTFDMLIGLADDYPVYDESDLSELECDEIGESWAEFMRSEVWRELPEVTRTTMWDLIGDDEVTEIWWACVSADVFGSYPEHGGVEVIWGNIEHRATEFRPYLINAYLAKRAGSTLPDPWVWVPMVKDHLNS